jgi:hypothetical protein
VLLQFPDRNAQGRLGQVNALGGAIEVEFLSDGQKITEKAGIDVHVCNPDGSRSPSIGIATDFSTNRNIMYARQRAAVSQ